MEGSALARGARAFAAATILALAAGPAAAVEFATEALSVPTREGTVELTVEIADTPARRAIGYMHRTDIRPEDGMLFVHAEDRPISMWMQNTPTSLDMIFLEADGTVESIATDTVPFSTDIVASRGAVRFVLEVLAGSAERWGLEEGDRLSGPRFER